jgi:hypothetical protein
MGCTCRKEKQSARTVQPKTFRAKGYKKRRRETREDFSRKEKHMRFAAFRRWKNDDARLEEQRAMFVSRPRATKGKTSPKLHAKETVFCANSISECSPCHQCPAYLHRPSLNSFTFNQLLPARASGPLAPGHRPDPRCRCAPYCSL